MAKYQHRTFEMYERFDETIDALTPKSGRRSSTPDDPAEWQFHQLDTSLVGVVTHVQFKERNYSEPKIEQQLRADFADLAERLINDSKVMLDFTEVESFSPGSIEAIVLLKQKLRNKGSRIVLACLGPEVRQAFFTTAP